MDRSELLAAGDRLLAQARRCGALPDAAGVRGTDLAPAPVGPFDGAAAAFAAALGFLRAEMELVRNGRTADLTVLDDEIANAERVRREL